MPWMGWEPTNAPDPTAVPARDPLGRSDRAAAGAASDALARPALAVGRRVGHGSFCAPEIARIRYTGEMKPHAMP